MLSKIWPGYLASGAAYGSWTGHTSHAVCLRLTYVQCALALALVPCTAHGMWDRSDISCTWSAGLETVWQLRDGVGLGCTLHVAFISDHPVQPMDWLCATYLALWDWMSLISLAYNFPNW